MLLLGLPFSLYRLVESQNYLLTVLYIFLAIEFGFPGSATGLIFAVIETFGGLCILAVKPLINAVTKSGDFGSFYKTMIGMAISLFLVNIFFWPIILQKGPRWYLKLDQGRAKSLDIKPETKLELN